MDATFCESPVVFECQGESLLGILSAPVAGVASSGVGVLIIVGGPQYRAGSHRQFVQLARAAAAAGHHAFRFDVRGMGDSTGNPRGFEEIDDDIDAAVRAFASRAPGVRRLALMGLCDGASAALLYVASKRESPVAALCLLNPWVRSEASLARTHVKHYYARRFRQPEFWRKVFKGQVGGEAVKSVLRALRLAFTGQPSAPLAQTSLPFAMRMARSCASFEGHQLIALSEVDLTAREFADQLTSSPVWAAAATRAGVTVAHLPEADHTLSTESARQRFDALALQWLDSWSGHRTTGMSTP